MWAFMFKTIENGEYFFIKCHSFNEAEIILEMSGFEEEELEYHGRYSVELAEELAEETGLGIY